MDFAIENHFGVTLRVFGVSGFGPLDENETMKGVCESSLSSSLLNIVAVEFLPIGKHLMKQVEVNNLTFK